MKFSDAQLKFFILPKNFYPAFLPLLCLVAVFLSLLSCGQSFEGQIQYKKAQRMHDTGRVEEIKKAVKIYRKLLKYDAKDRYVPDNADVMYDLAVAYVDLHQRQKAYDIMLQLRDKNRDDLANMVQKVMRRDEMIR